MLAIQFPSSPIDARTPSPPTSFHADYYTSAPLLAPPPVNKRRAGPPKLSLQITSETRRTFSKSSIPPVSAGPLSPTSLSTQRNTQFNARRDSAPTSFSAAPIEQASSRTNGSNKKRRMGARTVGFAEGVEVIGYSVRWEDKQPQRVEEESSSSSSSEDDEEEVRARKVGGNLRGLEQMEALKLGRGSSRGYNWRMKMLNSRSSIPTTTDEVTEPMSATLGTSTGGVGFGFGSGIGRFS
ncbi:unnamed protein product [Tuber melanosporum]|uniref:(Perigord truffle) hypothetical protein n=1 Tax=Tuber melanosporum (strain Mel28) TaxID=656061 RepID=D5G6W0_TUBMM|nr:uncharacterized protein GSTUM_00002304001 [Tuber melanosporum]CAZ80253.1 unnamed protein product [Tuber melanosporum]